MDFDDSVMLPSQDDDSFLLSIRPISSPLRQIQVPERTPMERESRRAVGERKLEDGRRRTEEIVARLREERKKRESRDRTVSSSTSVQGAQPLSTQTVSKEDRDDDQERGEWEDIQDPGKENDYTRQRTCSSQSSPSSREEHVAKLKARLAESRMRRENSFVKKDKGDEKPSESRTDSDQASTFRNSALARIMSRGDRPGRPRVDRDSSQPRSSASKASTSTHHSEEKATRLAAPLHQEDGKSNGDRLVEKLLRADSMTSKKRTERTDEPESMMATHPCNTASKASTAPITSQPTRTSPATVLERIDEQTQEGQESLSIVSPPLITGKHEIMVEAEEGRLNDSINTSSSGVRLVQDLELPQTPLRSSEPQATSTPSASIESASTATPSSRASPTRLPETNKQEGHPHDVISLEASRHEASAEVCNDHTPTAASKDVPEEQQWEDVEAVHVVMDESAAPMVPVMMKQQAMMPSSSIDPRIAELLMPVQPQAGPSTITRVTTTVPAFTQSRRLKTTCPRTPVFARAKRPLARESPIKRVMQARPAERLIDAASRSSVSIKPVRPSATNPRAAFDDLATRGPDRSSINKIAPPVVEGIARKPSSIVKIPDFEKAHKAAAVKVKRAPLRLTRPDSGKTPGRTSRARMMERAEFDKANQDYQKRREDALKRYKQDKEDAAWAAELEARKAIAFKANPVPDFIKASRGTS